MISPQQKKSVQQAILRWYKNHRRKLIWRNSNNPYEIFVSEIMLQQTQVNRVQEKLPLFLKRFPHIHSLAASSRADVLRAWSGMGYNHRAIRLHQCANIIAKKYSGKIPSTMNELWNLPGVGTYTASAICAFAFQKNVAVVDVNIRRVYSRMFWKMSATNNVQSEKRIRSIAEILFPQNQSSQWHQAIMDLGATYCLARNPKCNECIINAVCVSAFKMKSPMLPKKKDSLYFGKPKRYWRGIIVEKLRTKKYGRYVSADVLLRNIFDENKIRHSIVCRKIFANFFSELESDGMLESQTRAKKIFIRLQETL
jgi:A/G-specific adenine glycosylase